MSQWNDSWTPPTGYGHVNNGNGAGQPQYDQAGNVVLPSDPNANPPPGPTTTNPQATAAANGQPGAAMVAPQPTAMAPQGMNGIPLWEWLMVGLVGIGLGMAARTFGTQGVATAAGIYLLGYWVRGRRPGAGWSYLPSPLFAMGQR